MVLLAGSEAISTVRHLTARGETRDWAETVEGRARGPRLRQRPDADARPRLRTAPARRSPSTRCSRTPAAARLGLVARRLPRWRWAGCSRRSPKSRPATRTPCRPRPVRPRTWRRSRPENRLTSDPFPRRMVARDQANQGAAVLLTSVGKARALGVPEDRWVYLHGGADVKRAHPDGARRTSRQARRPRWRCARRWRSPAHRWPTSRAFDLYSCFPIAVFNICDALGLGPDDPRGLTRDRRAAVLRRRRQQLLDARHRQHGPQAARGCRARSAWSAPTAASCRNTPWASIRPAPAEWRGFDSAPLQREIDGWAAPELAPDYAGEATVETYTIDYAGKAPRAVVIGRTPSGCEIRRRGGGRRDRPPSDRRGAARRPHHGRPPGRRPHPGDRVRAGAGDGVLISFSPAGEGVAEGDG